MKRSRWIKPFIRITSAAILTSLASSGISFLILTNINDWHQTSSVEGRAAQEQAQRKSHPLQAVKEPIYMEYRVDIVKPALKPMNQQPDLKTIQQAVKDAIDALAQHKPFANWKGAHTEIQALGPGTHGWVVHIKSAARKPLGYLIIQATEEGNYTLTEYGTGEYYPFAKETLTNAMQDMGWSAEEQQLVRATPYYVKPLLAVWKLEFQSNTHWVDASSGEQLPELTPLESNVRHASIPLSEEARGVSFSSEHNYAYTTKTPILHLFDPYDQIGWMADSALRWTGDDAQRKLRQWNPKNMNEKLIYVQMLNDSSGNVPKLNFPYAITGEQLWKMNAEHDADPIHKYRYVAIKSPNSEDVRYVSDSLLLTNGYITTSPTSIE